MYPIGIEEDVGQLTVDTLNCERRFMKDVIEKRELLKTEKTENRETTLRFNISSALSLIILVFNTKNYKHMN